MPFTKLDSFFFTNFGHTLEWNYISVFAWTVLFFEVSFSKNKKMFQNCGGVFLASSTFLSAAAPFVSEEQQILWTAHDFCKSYYWAENSNKFCIFLAVAGSVSKSRLFCFFSKKYLDSKLKKSYEIGISKSDFMYKCNSAVKVTFVLISGPD